MKKTVSVFFAVMCFCLCVTSFAQSLSPAIDILSKRLEMKRCITQNSVLSFESDSFDEFFTTKEVGALSLPFTLTLDGEAVQTTDIFGNPTGKEASFRFIATEVTNGAVTNARFAGFVFFEGPRQNVYHPSYASHALTAATAANVLTNGVKYLAPAVVWKKDDFLVAVKGLEKFYGMDSLTIPTQYRDKGILPLRGLAWTDPVKAATIFRVDTLLGVSAFLGVTMNSIYIQA